MTVTKKFDLNIEKVLEDWEIYHAIREIIANALDEQVITNTKDIEISHNWRGSWHIRDFGRGLRYKHLTQNENEEKLKNPHLIGKFGVGLKDALATFNRRGIDLFIKSAHGDITLDKTQKYGFEDIETLHAYLHPPSDPEFIGTEFVLRGCSEEDIKRAKELFLKFTREKVLESTQFGEVLEKKGRTANVYINGVKLAEEENFLFSYNITSLTSAIKKALNRERTNVGRIAYSERVKSILLDCKDQAIANILVDNLRGFEEGTISDELRWADIYTHAIRILSSREKTVFFTANDLQERPDMYSKARDGGYSVITVPETIREKIKDLSDLKGEPILELDKFKEEWNSSFEFRFVESGNLDLNEKEVFSYTDKLFKIIGGRPPNVKEVKISETMLMNNATFREADGLWQPSSGQIIIKRSKLGSISEYAGVLIHEAAHALGFTSDVSVEFEEELTRLLGVIASRVLLS